MARIKYGGIVTDISGSVSGSTFQRGIYGATMRKKPNPIRSATPAQMLIRGYMMQLHYAWSALAPEDRTQWDRFISFSSASIRRDKSVLMSGHDLFIKYNLFRLINNWPVLSTIAYSVMPEPPVFVGVGKFGVTIYLVIATECDKDVLWIVPKFTNPRNPSLSYSPVGLRFMDLLHYTFLALTITPQYIAAFGKVPNIGDTLHYSIRWFSMTAPVYTAPITGTTVVYDYTP